MKKLLFPLLISLFVALPLQAGQYKKLITDSDLSSINYTTQEGDTCLPTNVLTILKCQGETDLPTVQSLYTKTAPENKGSHWGLINNWLLSNNFKVMSKYQDNAFNIIDYVTYHVRNGYVVEVSVDADTYYDIPLNQLKREAHSIAIVGYAINDNFDITYIVLDTNYNSLQLVSKHKLETSLNHNGMFLFDFTN